MVSLGMVQEQQLNTEQEQIISLIMDFQLTKEMDTLI